MKAFHRILLIFSLTLNLTAQTLPNEAELRAAVSAGGTVRFTTCGTIALSAPLMISRDVTIDASSNTVTLDGRNSSQLIILSSGVRLELKGLILANGSASGAASGGAINGDYGFLSITNCVFRNNHASGGGGGAISLSGSGGLISIQDSTFISNSAGPKGGGAIYAPYGGDLEIDATSFENNQADFEGGAIWCPSEFKLTKSVLKNNSAGQGAAIFLTYGDGNIATISNSLFVQNSAVQVGVGGAISVRDISTYVISGCSFVNNSGAVASAIWDQMVSTREIVNSTFFKNFGGQVIHYSGIPRDFTLRNVTFANNLSSRTLFGNSFGGHFVFKNSLFGTNVTVLPDTVVTDAGNNLSATGNPAFNAPTSRNNIDVKLGDIDDYGGDTPTMPLLAGSPAIDAGDDTAAPQTDQRGRIRPFGSHSDIGAFESSTPFLVVGKVNGDLSRPITVKLGNATLAPNTDGHFQFAHPGGQTTLEFLGPADVLFRPTIVPLDIVADTPIKTRVFKIGALAFDPDLDTPAFTFAGNGGEIWKFETSFDFHQWNPVFTNTFPAAGLFSIPFTNSEPQFFIQGLKVQ